MGSLVTLLFGLMRHKDECNIPYRKLYHLTSSSRLFTVKENLDGTPWLHDLKLTVILKLHIQMVDYLYLPTDCLGFMV